MIKPRNLRAELAAAEVAIRRAAKQKANQPKGKRLTAESYATYMSRRNAE